MASSLLSFFFFFFTLLLFNLQVSTADSEIAFEDGYTVSTVIDGHKLKLNPHSILPRFGSSDLIILDSVGNAFYTISFSESQEIAVKPLSGGDFGFLDGDLATAKFKKPKSFAVDFNGNVYVADKGNSVVRKISKTGVTTIAGDNNSTVGHVDGPGRNASFSSDFELAFVPERCALMICDHGNQLVRQINLKAQDCARGPQPVLGMAAWAWALGLGVSCLLGFIIGFAIHPYIAPHTGRFLPISSQQDTEAFPNQSGETSTDVLLRRQKINTVETQTCHKKSVSLLDSEIVGSKVITKPQIFAEQLKDLITLDEEEEELPNPTDIFAEQLKDLVTLDEEEEELPNPTDKIYKREDDNKHGNDPTIDNMIQASIVGFEEQAKKVRLDEFVSSSGLVKRR